MERCPICGKGKVMKVPASVSNAGEDLWRCPQHHHFTLDGDSVPEPGSDAWRERGSSPKPAAKKRAPRKKNA